MKKENIEFLENLKKKLLTQDNMATRDIMFAIQDEKEISGFDPDYCMDKILEVYSGEDCYKFSTVSDIIETLVFSNETESKLEKLDDNDLEGTKYILDEAGCSTYLTGVKTKETFELDNDEDVFLTKKAAKEYLQENCSHYEDVSIYGISAYNNPEMRKLREIIMNTDWRNSNNDLKEEKFKILFDAIVYSGYNLNHEDKKIIHFFLKDSILKMDFENIIRFSEDCSHEDLPYALSECNAIINYFEPLNNDKETKDFLIKFLNNHKNILNDYQYSVDDIFDLKKDNADIIRVIDYLSQFAKTAHEFLILYINEHNICENKTQNKHNLRSITLRDDEGQGDICVETNAPKEIIQEALMYRDELRERNQMGTTDYEVIQEYINQKGYEFKEADEDEEVYIW